ncbi:tetratricopeptide repeat protein [Leptospira sp. 2 VSF19]|uniref:Tetratricopeptide repeat protein n=1 Tax=Leptospira soteropolitanensis TaxID=2950025 RepID=A0AAW5VCB8_9LEPT|nr:tetratricopeptide repeat protein [Leptospira soteropolitanensis]MCW7492079.1 tetratricopeptide repeat protein [Leptospira soteropolitanensis]MCW7499661.1 tetratricopeptide repeat protein [Leptospira soteropolitanensis]MCW7521912.1 tetratricopeptide repeat protein [Leptospira soteropolitanensis]MCW7525766.1 tetratricopeptide repeat protein [Leptospira soteropolitanensis]MCW7530120.1 tetratricopeptide repeat protein [Leptospira soteropolitanensis]
MYRNLAKSLFWLFFLFLGFVSVSFLSAETSALEDIAEGKRYQSDNNCRKAIQLYQSALQKNRNSIEAKLGVADCSFQLGALRESKKFYKEILDREPKFIPAIIGLSEIYLSESDFSSIEKLTSPLLIEFPNHTGLRITEAKSLQKQGKLDSAIFKIKTLAKRLEDPSDLLLMLAELYFTKQNYTESFNAIDLYTKKEPNDPEGFAFKAKVLLYQSYFYPNQLKTVLPLVEESIQNSINLDSKGEHARFYSVYHDIILSNLTGEKDIKKRAFRTIYELAREFPENQLYHSLEANLAWELGETKFATYHYRRALQLDDLDEILRFEAEEYSIANEKEESKLRRELGDYRRDRFYSEKHSLYHKSSLFHLKRAKDLSPQTPTVRKEILEFYNQTGETAKYTNLLLRLREEDPNSFKLQNKLEFSIKNLKESLEFREGYIQIDPNVIQENIPRFSPEVYVFDLESSLPFPYHLQAGRLLAEAFRYNLKQMQSVRVVEGDEFKLIRNLLKDMSYHPFSQTIPFTVDNLHLLDSKRKNATKIRYVVHGRYQIKDGDIRLDVSVYDRNSLRDIATWSTNQRGRDSLPTIIHRVAERIRDLLPKEGKILKVKKDEVIVSLGKDDGLLKNSKLEFQRKGKTLFSGEIIELGKSISSVKPNARGWEKELATGDDVILSTDSQTEKKNK